MCKSAENYRETAAASRRILAYLIDYLVIAIYFGVMTALSFLLRGMGVASNLSYVTLTEKLQGQAFAVLFFTLPVVSYCAVLESSGWQATIGKRRMGLQVVGIDGRRISLSTSFLRSVAKFLPWEIAHTGIWQVTGQPFLSPPGTLSWCAWCGSLMLALWWLASLFLGSRRAPYDWIAKTQVVPCSTVAVERSKTA